MRRCLAGWLGLSLFLAATTVARAQVKGEVESIGFDGYYRPNCWTPMVVRLSATTSSVFDGRLTVVQNDPDGDHVTFTRPIQLAGNNEGSGRDQRFWMYFIPEPPTNAKPEPRVFICDSDGKQLVQLPVTQEMLNLDDRNAGNFGQRGRGNRLVLYVSNNSHPAWSEYNNALGLNEDLTFLGIPAAKLDTSLPESVIGYESVDAILWLDADPGRLLPRQRAAFEQYVRNGGQLVVGQTGRNGEWENVASPANKASLADMLPVVVDKIIQTKDLAPLEAIHREAFVHQLLLPSAIPVGARIVVDPRFWKPWSETPLLQPVPLAVASPKPGAVVDITAGDSGSPYLARWGLGLGNVTWVAQDLGDSQFLVEDADRVRWMYIWDRLFDWPNNSTPDVTVIKAADPPRNYYPRAPMIKLDYAFLRGMDLANTGALRVGMTILFFIAYWILAGPVAYIYLASKKHAGLSWIVFGGSALVATVLTVVIVQAVLRGPSQVQHVSFVRIGPGDEAVVHSGLGLYIPHDGYQTIALADALPDTGAYITAFPIHPDYYDSKNTFTAHQDYDIPVMDAREVHIPYRSTLKRLQLFWTGTLPGIVGKAALPKFGSGIIRSSLTNATGVNLRNIYCVFHRPPPPDEFPRPRSDSIIFFDSWPHGDTRRLEDYTHQVWDPHKGREGMTFGSLHAFLTTVHPESGNWDKLWLESWQKSSNFLEDTKLDETNVSVPRAFPLLSLFDRLPVMAKIEDTDESTRYELGRLWGRFLDASHDVSAGELVILAQADDVALPVPLDVNSTRVTGSGTTYYQFIIPLDQTELETPATAPATVPTAGPGTARLGNPQGAGPSPARYTPISAAAP